VFRWRAALWLLIAFTFALSSGVASAAALSSTTTAQRTDYSSQLLTKTAFDDQHVAAVLDQLPAPPRQAGRLLAVASSLLPQTSERPQRLTPGRVRRSPLLGDCRTRALQRGGPDTRSSTFRIGRLPRTINGFRAWSSARCPCTLAHRRPGRTSWTPRRAELPHSAGSCSNSPMPAIPGAGGPWFHQVGEHEIRTRSARTPVVRRLRSGGLTRHDEDRTPEAMGFIAAQDRSGFRYKWST
jgi:hypothetical protein